MYENDTGVYTCRAWNDHGEATISCNLTCAGKRNLILDSQLNRLGLDYDKIAKLEGLGNVDSSRSTQDEDEDGKPPELTQLSDIEIQEGGLAHFEVRLLNKSSKIRIEWFHNGRVINSLSVLVG